MTVKQCIYQCGNQIETEFLNKTCNDCRMDYHDVCTSHNIVELYDYCIDNIEQQHRNYNKVAKKWNSAAIIFDTYLSKNISLNQDEKRQLLEKLNVWLLLVKEWAFLESASVDELTQYCLDKLKQRIQKDNHNQVTLFHEWDDGTFITESLGLDWVVKPKVLQQLHKKLDLLIKAEQSK